MNRTLALVVSVVSVDEVPQENNRLRSFCSAMAKSMQIVLM